MLETLALLAGIFAFYMTGISIYYITFHPLANIPGPKLCGITRIPYWLVLIKGEDVKWMKALHDRYGPVVRFGPTDVSYATGEAWNEIAGPKDSEKALEFSIQPINGVPSMLTQNVVNHARMRRLFSPAFSERALKQQEPLFRKYADLLMYKISEVGEDGAKPIEMSQLLNFATFDVMAELCFGANLNLLAKNEYSPWVKSVFAMLKMLPIVTMINYYPILNALFTRFEPKFVTEQRVTHCKHAAERVDRRLESGSDKPDVWNFVLEAKEGKGLTVEEMHSNAELFMLAGSETTATVMSGFLYYLLKSPDKMEILLKEIRGRFTNADEISFESAAELKYLNTCVKETLRIYPPAPIGSPRVVSPGGQQILGKYIPAETRVSVHHWSTYRSESNFKDADKFVPERWLRTDPKYAGDALDAHQPFSIGPRNCLGQNMALHEMRLILAVLLFKFDLELEETSEDWADQKAFGLWQKKPLMMRAKPASTHTKLNI
ncbi:cytochrome P450 [Fusarium flagelliforme]|uniref:cytochrome P450 n=1 Tax=Fusarium flagelliforme TaxID=2675880 RepID=UPI001E8DF4F8|nr:cytochrome P450 [Fusarium flagelliforme]KAH7174263.1 cytochrome P450 [Fusarium flagelliforme]